MTENEEDQMDEEERLGQNSWCVCVAVAWQWQRGER